MGFSRLCMAERRGVDGGVGLALLRNALLGLVCVVCGCATSTHSRDNKDVPPLYATVVGETDNKNGFEYLVNNPGRATLYDGTANHVIFATDLQVGDQFSFTPDHQRVCVNGRSVHETTAALPADKDHLYQLYWNDTITRPPYYTN